MINQNLLLTGDDGYNLTNSLRFRSSASAYLNRTPATASNRKTWTWSGWVKRGTLGVSQYFFSGGTGGSDTTQFGINFLADNKLNWLGGSGTQYRTTTQVFRDPAAWYHIVLAFDTTLATANDRIKIYVNGTQITAFDNLTNPTQNVDYGVNQAEAHNIGRWTGASGYFDGYLAEVNFIDGQALTPSSFGETSTTTGVWIPKKYTGTYGTNGFYLPFTNTTSTSTLGNDFSGNSNTWTVNNISLTSGSTYDSMTDVPTLTSATTANYAVLNPLQVGAATTLTAANLNNDYSGTATDSMSFSSIAFESSNSNFYAEFTYVSSSLIGSGVPAVGICDVNTVGTGNISTTGTAVIYHDDGTKTVNGTNSSYGATWTTGDVIGVQINNGTVTFYKNGTTQGSAATGLTGTYKFVIRGRSGTSRTFTIAANFGQRPFGNLPSGALALNTFNLPTPTIGATASTTANKYFDATLYTGNSSTQTVTNSGSMQPDWVWIKDRSAVSQHVLTDSVRGVDRQLFSSLTNAEQTSATAITSFNSNGFTTGVNPSPTGATNSSPNAFVAWQWRASNATAVTNTAGSITSTVSANTTAGFSIVTYTGTGANATVGHGLGVAPSMVIYKRRNATDSWVVYNANIGAANNLVLNSTQAQSGNGSFYWNSTAPTSSVISTGTDSAVNASGSTYVAYCFAPVAGYSAFGSYTGNGSTDGVFVYTGFKPKFLLIKRSDSAADWYLYDSARGSYNENKSSLYPNSSDAEGSSLAGHDFLSNGFKVRTSINSQNTNGGTYIYMAFAENPFKYSLAR